MLEDAWEEHGATVPAFLPPLPPGVIEGYRLLERVNEGAQGVVYRARSTRWDLGDVAIKICRPCGRKARHRFVHEASVLQRVRHACIPELYDHGVLEHHGHQMPYLVMDYVVGVPVTEYVSSSSLDSREIIRLVAGCCTPLRTLHASGIVHRDIKPANILVSDDGKPMLIDFGVVQDQEASDISTVLTTQRQIIGTVAYMAPEQTRGDSEAIGPWTDVFSLAVILYEMLAGRHPFARAGTPPMQILRSIDECAVPGIHDVATSRLLPVGIEAVLQRALSRDTQARYLTAEEFRVALLEASRTEMLHRRRWGQAQHVSGVALRWRFLRTHLVSFVLGVAAASLTWQLISSV